LTEGRAAIAAAVESSGRLFSLWDNGGSSMRDALFVLLYSGVLTTASVAPEPYVLIPHVVDGDTWKTTFKFANLGTRNVRLFVSFYQDDAVALALPIKGNADVTAGTSANLSLTLIPGQTITVETAGTAPALASGWGVAQQLQNNPEPMGAMAIYTQRVPGGQEQEATVPLAAPIRGNFALLFDNTAFVTGVAVVNQSDATVPLIGRIHDATGKVVDQQTLLMPKYSHVAFVLPTLWRSTAGIGGWIEFVNPAYGISAFGLRFSGAAFTAFSPFPMSQ
jgi:hypothetical protein